MSDNNWQPIETAPRDGTVVKIKVDIESVQAYWEPNLYGEGLGSWVLTRPLHMESVWRPTRWKPAL